MCITSKKIMPDNIKDEIVELFINSQKTVAVHQKNSIILRNLFQSSNRDQFSKILKNIVNIMLVTEKSTPYLEKLMSFFGMFCSLLRPEDDDQLEHPFLTEIMSYLLQASESIKDVIRLRSCQLINRILDSLVGTDVSEELCEKLEETLLVRLQDPKSTIRQQAVISLHRLQVPDNPNDPIISGIIHLMNSDSSAKARQLCIEKIAASKKVIQHLINRTRDSDANVRLVAFKRLSTFAGSLKISEKRQILHCGFNDECEKVREFIDSGLVNSWLEHYNNNVLVFMKSLRLDADEKDIENTVSLFESSLAVIFKKKALTELTAVLPLNDKRLVPHEDLNWEVVSYWRIYVQFLNQNENFEEELEKVLPEMIYFCKYIKEYYMTAPKEITATEFAEQQFVLRQLFTITTTYDFADPTNRKCLNALVANVLTNVVLTSDVVNVVVGSLERSIPKSDQRTHFVSELVSDILYPIDADEGQEKLREKQFQISRLTVKINELRASLEEAIQREDFMAAEDVKNDINEANALLATLKKIDEPSQQRGVEKKTDLVTTIKCLDVTAATLLSPKITRLTASLRALKEDFIQELLIHENDTVRVKAMKCYGLCCIADKETATTGIHIFSTPIFAYQNGEECDTQTLSVCISTAVDLLRIFGAQLVAAPETEALSESLQEKQQAVFTGGTSLTAILQGLVDLMDDEQYEIQEKAGLGLCQLILSDRIVSPSLICRLVLKWCNPAKDDETDRLRQIIGYTLQKMPLMTQCTEQLTEAVLLTIRTLFSAPRISPLADVNVENIAKFMVALCKTSPDAALIHSNLALTICGEIIKKPKSKLNVVLAKTLLMLEIPDDELKVDELLDLCDQIRDSTAEKSVISSIIKFVTSLNKKRAVVTDENTLKSVCENGMKLEMDSDVVEDTFVPENAIIEESEEED